MMNIAVFLPNWIGDVVMATPALRALREHFGTQATISGVMRPYVAEVLEGTNWLDEQIFFHPRGQDDCLGMWQLTRKLRGRGIDLAVVLPNSFRSALLARTSGAKSRVGYNLHRRGWLLNRRVQPPRQRGRLLPTSGIDLYLELAYRAGCPLQSRRTQLETTVDDELYHWDEDYRAYLALLPGGRVLSIAVNVSEMSCEVLMSPPEDDLERVVQAALLSVFRGKGNASASVRRVRSLFAAELL